MYQSLSTGPQKKEMDASLFLIAEKGSSINLHESRKKIERLKLERKQLIEGLNKNQDQLLQIRSLEYKALVFDNHTISPVEAAKFLRVNESEFNFTPGPTVDDTLGLPFTLSEMNDLYRSNELVSADEESIFERELPDFDVFWSLTKFKIKTELHNKLSNITENIECHLFTTSEFDIERILYNKESAYILRKSLLNKLCVNAPGWAA